eukprot:2449182-Pyramimonas_sp.AAC.1
MDSSSGTAANPAPRLRRGDDGAEMACARPGCEAAARRLPPRWFHVLHTAPGWRRRRQGAGQGPRR